MKILYTLCGEGNGHATRSKVSILHLRSRGHDVLCAAASSPASKVMESAVAPDRLVTIVGLGIRCRDGELDIGETIAENVRRLERMMTENETAWRAAEAFAPDAVVTDFDAFGWFFARSRGLPLVSVDNQQILGCFVHDPRVFGADAASMMLLERVNRWVIPDAEHFVVTSFFRVPARPVLADAATLVPPILRAEVLSALARPRRDDGPILVYRSSYNDAREVAAVLASAPHVRFRAYGFEPGTALPPNVEPRAFDEARFVTDLAEAAGVVGNGGMSLLGEAIALGKPVYAVPVRGQYEQMLNARYLAACGFGHTSERLDERGLHTFLERMGELRGRVTAAPQHDANARLYATLDRLFPSRSNERAV